MKKCIYCKKEISESSVVDFCENCGKGVWGEKMFKAIIQAMESARDKGDLAYMQLTSDKTKGSR